MKNFLLILLSFIIGFGICYFFNGVIDIPCDETKCIVYSTYGVIAEIIR